MSLITRITHEAARRLIDPGQYVTRRRATMSNSEPVVSLTFDDGPHPRHTERVLDQLARQQIQATFFLIGERARRHPDLVRRLLKEGHSVGSHTYSHCTARNCSAAAYVQDVHRGRDVLEQICGHPVDLFRPPYGELTPWSLLQLVLDGFRIIHWSRDPRDFECSNRAALIASFEEDPLQDGDVILMHDDRELTGQTLGLCLSAWSRQARFESIPMRYQHTWQPQQAAAPRSDTSHLAALAGESGVEPYGGLT